MHYLRLILQNKFFYFSFFCLFFLTGCNIQFVEVTQKNFSEQITEKQKIDQNVERIIIGKEPYHNEKIDWMPAKGSNRLDSRITRDFLPPKIQLPPSPPLVRR